VLTFGGIWIIIETFSIAIIIAVCISSYNFINVGHRFKIAKTLLAWEIYIIYRLLSFKMCINKGTNGISLNTMIYLVKKHIVVEFHNNRM